MEAPLPPHPVLEEYYGEAARREQFVRNLFDDTAPWYDEIIAMLSFGSGGRYRRVALERAGLSPATRLLDLACGTGVVAREALHITRSVVGADASIGMLRAGRATHHAPLVQCAGESLPFVSGSFDMVTIGYALRHFADLRLLFSESSRVLAPGGNMLILEITPPQSRAGYALLRFHLNRIVPLLARVRSGSARAKQLMHYYWDTIESCVPPQSILAALTDAGFSTPRRHAEMGIFSEYTARKE